MSEWKEYKIRDIAEVQTGPFGSQLHQSDYKQIGTPIITVEHLGENKIIHENLPLVGEEDKQRLIKYTLRDGDIVFSRVGSVDRRTYISKAENGWLFSGRCLRVRTNQEIVNPKYLSYYFGQESFKETIRRIAVGATMPSINTTILNDVKILIPELHYQNIIASIFSSLDSKIDLLYRQNNTLEQLAETLFKRWFVEEADENWEVGKLGDVLESIESGSRPRGGIDPNLQDGIPSIGAENINGIGFYDYSKTKFITKEFFESMKKGTINDYDVLIYKDGAYIGRKGMFADAFPFEICTVNEHVFLLKSNRKINQFFLYFLIQQDELEQLNTNSAQPGLNKESMKSLKIIIPSVELINKFGMIAKVWVDKIFFNCNQIRTLAQLRDTLIPKLMSGEVRVRK
jgi:type I restriction enzyme S subunit